MPATEFESGSFFTVRFPLLPLTEVMALWKQADRTKLWQRVLEPLIAAGWLARMVHDKRRSRFQHYVTTSARKSELAQKG